MLSGILITGPGVSASCPQSPSSEKQQQKGVTLCGAVRGAECPSDFSRPDSKVEPEPTHTMLGLQGFLWRGDHLEASEGKLPQPKGRG